MRLFDYILPYSQGAIVRHQKRVQSYAEGLSQERLPSWHQDIPYLGVSHDSLRSLLHLLTLRTGEDCFEKAESFIPERWCNAPDMLRNKEGFMPFGTGKQP